MKKKVFMLLMIVNISVYAHIYTIPKENNHLIGKIDKIFIPNDNKLPLEFFASKYQIGLSNLIEINPNIDVFLPKGGSTLIIPNKLLIPDVQKKVGIVINSVEMRLYYYPKDKNVIVVLPIGIGDINSDTPINWTTKVIGRKKNPSWSPTEKIRKEYELKGIKLPKNFVSGKDNPMGYYAMYIGNLYAIHGTNVNFGIGLRVSHGCIRLRNEDIEWLFKNVPVGTKVQFIDQPVKASIESDGSIYLEAHNPLSKTHEEFYSNKKLPIILPPYVIKILKNKSIDQNKVDLILKERLGIPIKINK